MVSEEMFEKLEKAVTDGDDEKARELAKEALRIGVGPLDAIEKGLAKGVRKIGELFDRHKVFLPDLIMTGNAMKVGCDVLGVAIPKGAKGKTLGRVLIGTVKGDVHSIGKDIVATMLEASGFEVYNIGEDIPSEVFVEKVGELRPDVLDLPALMTTTMPKVKEVIDALVRAEERANVQVIVGGAPTTLEWANEIGADAWAGDAIIAVKKSNPSSACNKHRYDFVKWISQSLSFETDQKCTR